MSNDILPDKLDEDSPTPVPMGGDMSLTRTSARICLGKRKTYGVTVSWPATPTGGTHPSGSFAIKENGGEGTSTWDTIAECSDADFIAAQPTGTGAAGGFTVKDVETTNSYVEVIWTPTSGGAKVVPVVEINAK